MRLPLFLAVIGSTAVMAHDPLPWTGTVDQTANGTSRILVLTQDGTGIQYSGGFPGFEDCADPSSCQVDMFHDSTDGYDGFVAAAWGNHGCFYVDFKEKFFLRQGYCCRDFPPCTLTVTTDVYY